MLFFTYHRKFIFSKSPNIRKLYQSLEVSYIFFKCSVEEKPPIKEGTVRVTAEDNHLCNDTGPPNENMITYDNP